METLQRIDAARREINAAIMMFFNDYDAIATHTVAAAGLQIVSDLAEKYGKTAGINWVMESIIPEKRAELKDMFRAPQNFFKHADREGNDMDTLQYRSASLESYLMLGCLGYNDCTGMFTPEMRAFMFWVGLNEPQVYKDSPYKLGIEEYLKNRKNDTLSEHKIELLRTIANLREQQPQNPTNTDYR